MVRAVREKGSYENIFKTHETELFKFASRNFLLGISGGHECGQAPGKGPAHRP